MRETRLISKTSGSSSGIIDVTSSRSSACLSEGSGGMEHDH